MKTILFEKENDICEAFQSALETIMRLNPDAKGIKPYKLFEDKWECKLHYDVEVNSGACTGVTIDEDMLLMLLLKHSERARLPSLLR
jgi:hypothetical protein